MATVGYVTDQDKAICLACHDYAGRGTVGRVVGLIADPAPNGLRDHGAQNGHRYDEPCALCGWAIRRHHPRGEGARG